MTGAIHPPAWTERALCAQVGSDFWYPEQGDGGSKEARKVCSECPVREQCLAWALDNDERFGIWGGLSERERRKLPRSRRCRRCGEIFEPASPGERMCSDECRRRTIEDSESTYGCIQCGAPTTALRCSGCAIRHQASQVQPRRSRQEEAA